MDNLREVWGRLDARRRAIVAGATLAALAAVALLASGGRGPGDMALLYAGLDPAAAGEVVAALGERGVPHEVRGDAIYVPEATRDLERMALAAEGLPATGGAGYELLDGLSGFGTTSQMFDAAYWRAKEGELARTILSVPAIAAARVHISAGGSRPFRREDPPTAAVTVTTRGGALSPEQAQALRHLVAAAVPGLAPADVAVIDAQGGLVAGEDADARPDARAEALRERAERLLEARVGPGNAVVEVSVDTVTETESIVERVVDPESRVAISTESEESESTSQGAGGAVTVASNLPDGEAAGGGGSTAEEATARTLTNYELSETSREVLRVPGDVRRLTVAVLVNDPPASGEGAAPVPRPAEELAALGELVASAVGLDAERGDILTIKSMPFEPAALGSEAAAPFGAPWDLQGLLRPALLALVAIVLGLFVVRPLLKPRPALPALPAPAALATPGAAALATPAAIAAGAGASVGASAGADAGLVARLPSPGAEPPPDPAARLRRLIESRQEETAQILRAWIDDAQGASAPDPVPARERA